MKRFIFGALALIAVLPSIASAQDALGNISGLVTAVGGLVGLATPIVVGIALLAFFWGLAKFIFNTGNEDAKEDGKRIMIWGVVALFVMVAVWGLVQFVGDAFDIEIGEDLESVPTVPGVGGN